MPSFTEMLINVKEVLQPVAEAINAPIHIGEVSFSVGTILFVLFAWVILYVSVKWLRNILVNKILTRYKVDVGVRKSVGTIFKYVLYIFGSLIIVQSTGVKLGALTVVFGALGVGIGFGLQNITNNFISGIIILFERPIKVGDRIEVGLVKGDVVDVAARATTIITNDNISLIVPNSEFISNTVTNWSHNDRRIRLHIPVGVSYKEDPRRIRRLLLEVVAENSSILTKPKPDILFIEFGDSSLNFEITAWTSTYTDRPVVLKSQLNYAIFKKFTDNNVEIPFPQRDLHIRTETEKTVVFRQDLSEVEQEVNKP